MTNRDKFIAMKWALDIDQHEHWCRNGDFSNINDRTFGISFKINQENHPDIDLATVEAEAKGERAIIWATSFYGQHYRRCVEGNDDELFLMHFKRAIISICDELEDEY